MISQVLAKSSEPQLTYLLNGDYNRMCAEGELYDQVTNVIY